MRCLRSENRKPFQSANFLVQLQSKSSSSEKLGPIIVLGLALAKILFHLLTAGRYGIFRDELYYLACSEHLDWGYVDQPPLIALIAWFVRHLFGESLIGLRLIPAIAGGATVWLAGKFTRELGGGTFAQVTAALSVIAVPVYLILHHWLTMNAFEPLIWLGCAWCFARAINRDDARYWIWFGLLAGLGMENKYTIAFFLFAFAVGLMATRARRFLFTWPLWIGAAIALIIFLPNLLWLVANHFPFLELMHNIRNGHRDVVRGPIAFIGDQIAVMNPVLAPLWIGGLIWLLIDRSGKYRALALAYLVMLAAFILLHGKNYYLTSVYPILFAAGAIAFERMTSRHWRWSRAIYLALIAASAIILAPTVAPILSPERAVAYQKKLGFEPPKAENQNTGPLPQYFADEFGWEEMTREVARIYNALSPDERATTAIFANSYGQAGAIDFFGPRLGLPKSISNHQSYWLWGPRGYDGNSVIVLGSDGTGDREHLRRSKSRAALGIPTRDATNILMFFFVAALPAICVKPGPG
jgi:hypothetical protein